jgi:hypothetical protein
MKTRILTKLFIFFSFAIYSQNFTVNIQNLKEGDSVTVIAMQSSDKFYKKWVKSSDTPNAASFNLSTGDWAIKIDATGYTYSSQKVVTIPNDVSATFALTEMMGGNYTYNWVDDGSAAGHATQSYIAEPTEIIVLNDTISVPTDFSSLKLRTEYGVVLSDDKEKWTNEDAYRLYKMFSNLPYHKFGEGSKINYGTGENIRGVFYLSKDEIYEDISIEKKDGIPHATVSQSAFTYAEPQIVKIDGIRGKFFSKRLYHAVVNFITDFANNVEVLNWLARERFGIQFLQPSDFFGAFQEENGTFMGDDKSNFQEFYKTEKLEILAMFEELPEGFHKQEGLKYLVRRIDGQDHPDPNYKEAAAIAWTGLKTIEFMSKAFIGGNLSDTRRLILHEKAHFLWEYTFDKKTKDDWAEIGGWFQDAASGGWSTYNTTEFVSAYAHAISPNEDMAESIAIYLTNPDRLINVSQKKYEFIRDRIMHGTRYVSIIREDLTFTVYNLYPDYTFPGKIVELDLMVEGASEEDKKVTMKIRLNSTDPSIDGAKQGYVRFASSIGTIFDIGLHAQNGSVDSVLVGSARLSKFAKSGYWTLASLRTWDQVGNQRYENTSTVGAKLFIENPLEDITPPKFLEYNITRVDSTFNSNGKIDPNGEPGQAIKIVSKWEEINTPLIYNGDISRIDFPNPDQAETYYKEVMAETLNPQDTIKTNVGYWFIPNYYPSGYYATTNLYTGDIAGNYSYVNFSNNPDNNGFANNFNSFVALKDSVYIATKYPDIVKPEIDLNNIKVVAEPTNPQAPNGETRVDINFNARDLSDFPGYEAGIEAVNLTLRDPQGKKFGYQTGNATMNHPDIDYNSDPTFDSEWRNYRFDLTLPVGSAPGLWGISDIVIRDKVGNTKSYNFEEYIRFDIIASDIVLEVPLEVEIVDKVINAGNVNSIKAKMSCKPCAGLNYVATIYSRFGGGAVVRSEGVLSADDVIVENLNTTGILDGEVNLTVQLTDTESRLVATKTTAYTKDVIYPKAYYSRTNLENDGTSSLDDFVIDVVIESIDVGGSYQLNIKNNNSPKSNSQVTELQLEGDLLTESNSIENIALETLEDGVYKFELTITDPNGNVGEPEILYYKKEGNLITLLGSVLSTDDLITIGFKSYPNPFNEYVVINSPKSVQLEVFDISGRSIMKFQITAGINTIDVNKLSKGSYIFKYTYLNSSINQLLIKN